ncbi:MAG: T9SS type A sorting domain-containing protein [Bacteroidota bacterium]
MAGTNNGVFRTNNNGGNWTKSNTGIKNVKVLSLFQNGTDLLVGAEGNGSILISPDEGQSWTQGIGLPPFSPISCFKKIGNMLFAGSNYYGIYRSANNGLNLTTANTGLDNHYVNCLAISGSYLFAGTDGGFFRSSDTGATWVALDTNLASTYILSIAVKGSSLFAASKYNGIYRSVDNGLSWATVNNGFTAQTIYTLAVLGTELYASPQSNGVLKSADDGNNWTASTGLIQFESIRSFAISGTNLLAGSWGGNVWLTTNHAASWLKRSQGLNGDPVNTLLASGTYIFAGTMFSSAWRGLVSDIITGTDALQVSNPASLQNYPNPFRNNTTISYNLANSGPVRLYVTDKLGREIECLTDKFQSPGTYNINFNGSRLSAGIYFVNLKSNGINMSRKMLLY